MELKKLSNEQLELNLKSLIQKERLLVSEIVNHVAEVERRQYYLAIPASSLFDYLTRILKYPANSAQRVIDAVRLMRDVPQISQKLNSGELSMSQVTLVQKSIRQKEASSKGCEISKELKQSLIEEISGLTVRESQATVAQALDIEIKQAPKVQIQKDGSARIEFTLSKEAFEKLEKVKELYSHSLPSGSWDEVLEFMANKLIQQKTKRHTKKIKISPHVTTAKEKFVFQRDGGCQFKNSKTGDKCGSRWCLQVDHIQPLWAGGSNDLENLQAMCGKHNRYRYKKQAGMT